jgi:ariadne-1
MSLQPDIEYNIEEDYGDELNQRDENDDFGDINLAKTNSYIILEEKNFDIIRNNLINKVEEYTYLTRDQAILVLLHFDWNVERVKEKWYDNTEKYLQMCGIAQSDEAKKLLLKDKVKSGNTSCLVCMDDKTTCSEFIALECGHGFCDYCFTEHIKSHLEDNLRAVYISCPQRHCNLIIPESLALRLLEKNSKENDLTKYKKCIQKNFTDLNSNIKWCPNKGCSCCVRCDSASNKEIDCVCGHTFCFKCHKEGHRPCPCDMVDIWDKKNTSESENIKWITANTKPCPNCKKHIEKNQGCDHMTCRKQAGGCGYEFCWVCMGDWKNHKGCNKFDYDKQISLQSDRAKLKHELERYIHYFNRYMNHSKALGLALRMRNAIEYSIYHFNVLKNISLPDLTFLREGVETIIRSRRLLKYSYVFGFYLKEIPEKTLFEHTQSLLESNADKLHELMESDTIQNMLALLDWDDFMSEFKVFRNSIIDLYSATNKFIENLLNAIENQMLHLVDYKKMEEKY